MLGPLAAFAVLAVAPRAFDAVFVVSFCVALIGLSILVLFVENPSVGRGARRPRTSTAVSLRDAFGLLRTTALPGARGGRRRARAVHDQRRLPVPRDPAPSRLRRALPAAAVHGHARSCTCCWPCRSAGWPIGSGRGRVFVGGYLLLLPVYALAAPAGGRDRPCCRSTCCSSGAYYAATDGVLMALASALLPERLRGSGLALLVTATSLGRLLASSMLGAIWTWVGFEAAVLSFGIGLILAMALAGDRARTHQGRHRSCLDVSSPRAIDLRRDPGASRSAAAAAYVAWLRSAATPARGRPRRAVGLARQAACRVPERPRAGGRQRLRARRARAGGRAGPRRGSRPACSCERVYFAGGSRPLPAQPTGCCCRPATRSTITGPDFKRRHELRLTGHPEPGANLARRALRSDDRRS